MKRELIAKATSLIATLVLLSGAAAFASDTYKVDPAHSAIVFHVQHLGVAEMFGRFNDPSGSFTLDEANPGKNSVEISVKADNVDTAHTKRDKDLRSPDFFNVESYPAITFKSRKFEKTGKNTYRVSGDMTLLGVTKPVTVTATRVGTGKDPWGGYRTGFITEFTIRRSEFGMDFLLSGVGDNVHVTVSLEGIRRNKVTGFKSD